jgi:hypothetical protein
MADWTAALHFRLCWWRMHPQPASPTPPHPTPRHVTSPQHRPSSHTPRPAHLTSSPGLYGCWSVPPRSICLVADSEPLQVVHEDERFLAVCRHCLCWWRMHPFAAPPHPTPTPPPPKSPHITSHLLTRPCPTHLSPPPPPPTLPDPICPHAQGCAAVGACPPQHKACG